MTATTHPQLAWEHLLPATLLLDPHAHTAALLHADREAGRALARFAADRDWTADLSNVERTDEPVWMVEESDDRTIRYLLVGEGFARLRLLGEAAGPLPAPTAIRYRYVANLT